MYRVVDALLRIAEKALLGGRRVAKAGGEYRVCPVSPAQRDADAQSSSDSACVKKASWKGLAPASSSLRF